PPSTPHLLALDLPAPNLLPASHRSRRPAAPSARTPPPWLRLRSRPARSLFPRGGGRAPRPRPPRRACGVGAARPAVEPAARAAAHPLGARRSPPGAAVGLVLGGALRALVLG